MNTTETKFKVIYYHVSEVTVITIMAYRGGSGGRSSNNNKRPLGQSPGRVQGGAGFESQFSELASFQADVPPNKRQRTHTGGRSGPGTSRISPLKFDNNSKAAASKFQVVPSTTSGPSVRPVAAGAGTKFISKPILPSQKISQLKEAENEDLWGDDDDECEDLLLAASQVF